MNHSPAEAAAAEPSADQPRRRCLKQSYPFDYEGVGEDPSLPLQSSCLVWMKQVNQVDNFFKKKMDELRKLIDDNANPPESRRNHMVQLRLTMRQMRLAVEEKSVRNERFIDCVNNIANISAMAAAAAEAEKSAPPATVPKMKRLHNKLAELRRLKAEKRLARERAKREAEENEAVTDEIAQVEVDGDVGQIAFPSVTPSPPTVSETSKASSESADKSDIVAPTKRGFNQDNQGSSPLLKRIKIEANSAEPEVPVLKSSPKPKDNDVPKPATPSKVEEPQPSPPKEVEKPGEPSAEPPLPAPTPQKPLEVEVELPQEPVEPIAEPERVEVELPKVPDVSEPEQSLPEVPERPETPLDTFETSEEMPITREATPLPKKEVTPVPSKTVSPKATPKKAEKPKKTPEPKTPKKAEKPSPKKVYKKLKKVIKPKRHVTRLAKKAAMAAKPARKISTRKRIATRKSLDKPVLTPEEIATKKAERARLKEQRLAQRRREEADAAEVAMVAAQLEAEGEIPSRRAAATAAAAAIHSAQSPRSSFAVSNPLAAFAMTSPKPSESSRSGSTSTRGKRGGRGGRGRGGRGGSNLTRADLRSPSTVSRGGSRAASRRNTVSDAPAPVAIDTNLYCSCQTISYGDMIACEGEHCQYQWFHFGCVNVTKAPETDWFCPDCLPARRKPSSRRGGRGGVTKRGKRGRKTGA
uniref:PHD-type domain-containing protein n=1 Tax=Panagrellus redivivus TaxID=6233 RepID=A0A7E4ZZN1_PANRE